MRLTTSICRLYQCILAFSSPHRKTCEQALIFLTEYTERAFAEYLWERNKHGDLALRACFSSLLEISDEITIQCNNFKPSWRRVQRAEHKDTCRKKHQWAGTCCIQIMFHGKASWYVQIQRNGQKISQRNRLGHTCVKVSIPATGWTPPWCRCCLYA